MLQLSIVLIELVDQVRVSVVVGFTVDHILLNQREFRIEIFTVEAHVT